MTMGPKKGPFGALDTKNISRFGISGSKNIEIMYNVVILGKIDHGALFGALLGGRTQKISPDLESATQKT